VKYFVSANYLDQQGVVVNNDFQRYSIRANLDIDLSKKLTFGVSLSPSRTDRNRPADDPSGGQFSAYSTITSTYWIDPSAPIYQPNGQFRNTTQGSITTNWTANPLYQLYAEQEKRRDLQLILVPYLTFTPINGLSFRTQLSFSNQQTRIRNFKPSALVDDNLTPQPVNIEGARATLVNINSNNLLWENTARYGFKRGIHDFEGFVGYTVQEQTTEQSTISAKRILDENFQLPDFNNVDRNGTGNFTGSEEFGQNRFTSVLARVNYNLADKYLFNASIRRDGSSRFGREVKYGNFPAGSFAWRVTNEPFMAGLRDRWLDELRFEVGYGITGNNNITNYGHLGSVGNASYVFSGSAVLGNTLGSLANPLVTWEQSKQADIGLNATLFKQRIDLAFNLYEQITEGPLAQIPLSWITGYGSVIGNQDGRIRNRGFELQVNYRPFRNRNGLMWETGLNLSAYRNRILEYFDPRGFFNGFAANGTAIAISAPGQPIGMLRGYKITGLFTAAEIADANVPKYAGAREGSLKWVDGNGDGRLGIEEDYVILGSPHPDLMFGWNNQLSYKGFNLRTIFAGQLGGLIYDLRREIMWNVDGNFNIDRQMLDRWRPGDDPATKKFPTTVSLTGSTTRYVRFPSDNKLYDGSYIALKNITLGYNFRQLLRQNNRFDFARNLDIYLSVRNAFYIAAYKYGNPEVRRANEGSAVRSVNYGSYPVSRTVTLGLNLTF
jgi:TonB-dependent starch-binding outer membrane protein SusC